MEKKKDEAVTTLAKDVSRVHLEQERYDDDHGMMMTTTNVSLPSKQGYLACSIGIEQAEQSSQVLIQKFME